MESRCFELSPDFYATLAMTDDTDEKPARRRKLSIKQYATQVFQETSVSAVSAIVSSNNIWRQIFRVVVFLLFTAGFLYHCITFLSYLLQYPTVVNIEIERPSKFLAPAYTFCNFNPIKRSKLCSKYPELCIEPDQEFCKKYPKLCVENNTKIPKGNIFRNILGPNEIMELVHDWKELIVGHVGEEPEGPFSREDEDGYGVAACYSLFGRITNPLETLYRETEIWGHYEEEFEFNPRENDILYPNSKPGIVFSIHSPFQAVNPFSEGIFLRPGHLYQISVEMTEEELLPYPYETDCVNYTELWLKANKTGPRCQFMCGYNCLLKFTESCYNCLLVGSVYPSNKYKFCKKDVFGGSEIAATEICIHDAKNFIPCVKGCKDDCTRMKYSYRVQESFSKKYDGYGDTNESERMIGVRIEFEDSEIMKIKYQPQYQQVEAFSSIGGFIGIWLGVSLVQIVDVFESLFLITRYFFKKGGSISCSKKHVSERSNVTE